MCVACAPRRFHCHTRACWLQTFFTRLVSMDLSIPPLHNFAFGSLYRNCMKWGNTVHYDFANRGQIQ